MLDGTVTSTDVGWNAGAGVDYAFSPNWIGRVEYVYDDFGRKTYGFNALTGGNFSNRSVTLSSNTVRVGAMYKFAGE